MDLSLFLARFLGLYMLLMALIWLLRKNQFELLMKEILSSKALIAFSGLFALLFGLAIVLSHPIWEWSWRGVVTLLGYLAILQGIMRLAFTTQVQNWSQTMVHRLNWVPLLILVILGLYLTYHGFASIR